MLFPLWVRRLKRGVLFSAVRIAACSVRGNVTYTQGQSPEPRIREYFYYIDHQGQLFLDDTRVKNFITCFKDQHFLVFFFSRLCRNETGRYQDSFPFLSLCGRERNFVRCDDRPVVFTQILGAEEEERGGEVVSEAAELLSFCGGGKKLSVPFRPQCLFMQPKTGRLYHPSPERAGAVGLVRSALAIELSSCFEYAPGQAQTGQPTHFHWAGLRHRLTNELAVHFTLDPGAQPNE
ncbi:UPF0598 protein C8orf82 homolog isoform X1 [Lepisosteus oculatus]|uniref:Chromosome 8 open reading frame 82 n=1 Tax=Lepisosteus oculatus TaxID=7918 RepID=W5MPG9_LEPOC|nr:PREDICTED: UPF0598 protein C8orf82 homolog [Lepisosteus oculatus]